MANTFFTADQHFGHPGILRHEPRARPFNSIEEHDEVLVQRWNAVVNKNDVVWVLGDFAWTEEAAREALRRLRGRIRIVLGDHDGKWAKPSILRMFDQVHGAVGWKHRILLSHVPQHPGGLKYRFNLHGHLHSGRVTLGSYPGPPDPNYMCMSVECTRLTPVEVGQVREVTGWW